MSSADHEERDAGTVSAAAMDPNRVASHHSLDVLATVAETVSVFDRDPDRAEDSSPLPGDRALRPRKSHSGSRKDSYIAEASQQARCLVDRGTVSERPSTPYVGPVTRSRHPQMSAKFSLQGPATGGDNPQTSVHPQMDTGHPQTKHGRL